VAVQPDLQTMAPCRSWPVCRAARPDLCASRSWPGPNGPTTDADANTPSADWPLSNPRWSWPRRPLRLR